MLQHNNNEIDNNASAKGVGPLIAQSSEISRTLKQQIFEHVRGAGLCARVDISSSLQISPATVTSVINELIQAGYIHEVTAPPREGEPVRGRPPVSIAIRSDAFYVAGIKTNDKTHTAVIMDFAGNMLGSADIAHNSASRSATNILNEVNTVLQHALNASGIEHTQLSAIGLGLPGLIDCAAGKVIWSPMLDQQNIAFASLASDVLGCPVYIDNDTNLVTLAELWFGKGRTVSDFAVVTIEHGIGMGLVVNHRIYRGAHGVGMELGHTKVQLDGALCRCGQRGCLEAYVADYALVREASTALNFDPSEMGDIGLVLDRLFDEAKNGHEAATTIFKRAGRYLATGLANVINLFDPSLVILSGARMQYDFLYEDEVLHEMERQTLDWQRTRPDIEVHTWGDLLWAQGAAALALSELTETLLGVSYANQSAGAN
jgi:predicted NBD/HSP70 family sugar kinase